MNKTRRQAFTLVELLTVIAIIGILVGFLLVAVSKARERARRVQVEAEVRELAKAWKAYWVTYGHQHGWPFAKDGQGKIRREMDGTAMKILAGAEDTPTWNPEGLVFMEVQTEELENGFKDPWGKLYMVDFSSDLITGTEYYETAVTFPNRDRYEFE
ncbi:MAG: type II secretion system protein [Planctomycetes bacterium]|nr:type II secretion system protein [Planctomycetota bacterium]